MIQSPELPESMTQTLHRAFGALLVSGLLACSGSGPDQPQAQANEVQGGTKDSATAHNYAVGILSKLGSVCSGTLIAPNLVLTARHCITQPDPDGKKAVDCSSTLGKTMALSNLSVTTEPVIRGAKVTYPVDEISIPEGDAFCGNDIALLRLSKNIPSSEAEPAIPVVQFSLSDRGRLSGEITALGYGITSPNAADPGTRRIREKIDIICLPGDDSYDCNQTIYSSMIDEDREFITQGYVCSGDSGGGAFDQGSFASSGTPYVLGALSRGPQNETQCLAAIYSRTDKHAGLIISAARRAAEAGGYEAADWVKGEPAPAVGDTGVVGSLCAGDICTSTDATEPTSSAPATTIITTTGCSTAHTGTDTRTSGGAFGLALAVAALLGIRRRKR